MQLEMTKAKKCTLTVLTCLLVGCATGAKNTDKVKLGMSEEEVQHLLGAPHLVTIDRGIEYVTWQLRRGEQPFVVQFKDDKAIVVGYEAKKKTSDEHGGNN